ncbi:MULTISPECIES: hypothetical protein [Pyrobaculum]|uniref:Uncharacterized protein n=2 Tax=Pyrobaculum arsenaticum TaxID=121277 RepID=A4WM19_PYRAR|nr:hypothetical protein [Pyrobaculum arsenaticum]ABP51436.1 conserved hypothetical protein [Pyrobaculum arsenaticum DSM 13514]MCY0890245.1 hypothetical protein [Pyrobaculum arsenaticum]NYR16599.1 hypothetical protein [Pyrobaculum arsenaticum]
MKLYVALAVISAVYTVALTLGTTSDPYQLAWNGVAGALFSLALVISVVPLAGPLLYDIAVQIVAATLNPRISPSPLIDILKIASWVVNILFTIALALYLAQWKRPIARRIIRALLF